MIPLYAELRAFLDGLPKRATTYAGEHGWGALADGLRLKLGAKACERAGIEELHFHDLRGTAATQFYRAGVQRARDRSDSGVVGG
jgi:integrase